MVARVRAGSIILTSRGLVRDSGTLNVLLARGERAYVGLLVGYTKTAMSRIRLRPTSGLVLWLVLRGSNHFDHKLLSSKHMRLCQKPRNGKILSSCIPRSQVLLLVRVWLGAWNLLAVDV